MLLPIPLLLTALVGARASELPEDLSALKAAVVDEGVHRNWPADKRVRLSGAQAEDGTYYTVHQSIRVYYNETMVKWLEVNRPDGKSVPDPSSQVPDGAAMVAEVFPPAASGAGRPIGYLAMLRDSGSEGASKDGWVWSQLVEDTQRWGGTVLTDDAVERGFSLCMSCHASAVNNFTFASWSNAEGGPGAGPDSYDFAPVVQTTGTFQAQVNAVQNNSLREPLGEAEAQAFIDFYNQHAAAVDGKLPAAAELGRDDVVGFPFQGYDHTYARKGQSRFLTSSNCQGCHGATAQLAISNEDGALEGWARPHMLFEYNPLNSLDPKSWPYDEFNASQWAEWSVSIMGLAGRDPVFHAQAETERVLHPGVDPTVIDNVCYRCHGSMGQRQYHIDHGGDPTQVPGERQFGEPFAGEPNFNHYMIYSTPDSSYETGSAPYDQSGADPANAEYGALAREGISCLTCHHVGPEDGSVWDADNPDWNVFYGYPLAFDVGAGQTVAFGQLLSPRGFDHPFTSTFLYDVDTIMTPTPDLNQGFYGAPTEEDGATEKISQHVDVLGQTTRQQQYMGETNMCSGCHVVIVPKIPMQYPTIRNSGQISFDADGNPSVAATANYPKTDTPCAGAPATGNKNPATGAPYYNPAADPCAEFAYEQVTFMEWASSSSFGHTDPQTSCTFCHMPSVFSHGVKSDGAPTRITATNQVGEPDFQYVAVANTLNSGTESVFAGHRENASDFGAFPPFAYQAADVRLTGHDGYPRHRLMGINLHVHQMFQQFPAILGLSPGKGVVVPGRPVPADAGYGEDRLVPPGTVKNLLNAEETILTHAPTTVTIDLCYPGNRNAVCTDAAYLDAVAAAGDEQLVYRVGVSNNAGHRFPTGAGFRRGILSLRLLDATGKTLWVSGAVNRYGAIVDGASGKVLPSEFPDDVYVNPYLPLDEKILQPHYGGSDVGHISRQDQAQIYEVRDLDEYRHLTSSTTRLFTDVKDNRIPPAGWIPPVTCEEYSALWARARAEAARGPVSKEAGEALEELVSRTPGTGTHCAMTGDCSETNGLSIDVLTRITRPAGDAFTDPDYCTANPPDVLGDLQGIAGLDHVWYRIPASEVDRDKVARVVATMYYQLTPPGYLAARFADGLHFSQNLQEQGLEGGRLGNAVDRLLHITSRLDTDIENSIPDQQNLPKWASKDWTMTIGFDCYEINATGDDSAKDFAMHKCASPP